MGMMISPDFTEAVEMMPLATGSYKMRVTGYTVGKTQAGNQRINWHLETFGSDDSKLNGKKLRYGTNTHGAGSGFLREFLFAVTGEKWATGQNFDADLIIGRELMVTVELGVDDDGNQKRFPDVKSVGRLR